MVPLVMVGTIALLGTGRATAQDATPAAQPITAAVLAAGLPVDAPGRTLRLERYTIQPGATIPTHTHPGAYAIYVETGAFGFTVIKGEAQLVRAGSTVAETLAAGQDAIANAGDAIFENGGVVHSARNPGESEVVVTAAALLMTGMPGLQPTDDEGTPVTS